MCPPKPKIPKTPPPAERQAMQTPKDTANNGLPMRRYRRGFWSAIMTSPSGVSGPPSTTGTPGV